jgi:thiol-disulfide isomerase/thioredoxin
MEVRLPRRLLPFAFGLITLVTPLAAADVPRPSPEYAIKLTSGRQLLLSSYRGKVVALMFVSTDCPHCQDTCRLMEGLQKEYGPRGFQTLAVAFNTLAIMLVPEFIKVSGATFPVGYDERDPVFNYLQRSVTLRTYVPIMVFIDRKGIIRGQFMGDDPFFADREKNIRSMIEKLIREPGLAPRK